MKKIKMVINPLSKKSKINKEIYGHFSEHLGRCIYDGIYVGEDSPIPNVNGMRTDVVEALKEIGIPVLRWPGGCFADEYHWKDGIGPKDGRKKMVNTNWGGIVEDNSFGTHEFMELCEQLGCEPYIAGNLGSGTVQELAEWIEYMTFDGVSPMTQLRKENGRQKPWKVKYLGIGNENWGCGGNMTPEHYSNLYRQYQTFCKDFSGNRLYKVACGPNADDYAWTDKIMEMIKPWHASAISLHYYTLPSGNWEHKGSATDFSEDEYYHTIQATLHIEELIQRHLAIMDKHDPRHEIGLIVDEWGAWYDVEEGTNPGFLYQQNSMRDALIAAINLNIFNRHSDRIVMANIAQVVNVLQAVILTEGAKIIKTPTYHVFNMYKNHQEATLVESFLEETIESYTDAKGEVMDIPCLSQSVSEAEDGSLTVTLANASLHNGYEVHTSIIGSYNVKEGRILSYNMDEYNTFENPDAVKPSEFTDYEKEGEILKVRIPSCAVIVLRLERMEH